MNDFLIEAAKPIFMLIIGAIIGILKAMIRKSPIAKKEEFIKYHKYLLKPAIVDFPNYLLYFYANRLWGKS